jgi:hypothetical protein
MHTAGKKKKYRVFVQSAVPGKAHPHPLPFLSAFHFVQLASKPGMLIKRLWAE